MYLEANFLMELPGRSCFALTQASFLNVFYYWWSVPPGAARSSSQKCYVADFPAHLL